MGEEDAAPATTPPPPPPPMPDWRTYIAEDIPRTVQESVDSAIRSARTFQDFIPHIGTRYRYYEEAFFTKAKDELVKLRENPALAAGVAVASGLLLLRGPRRFLIRQTIGRLQSEEAQFVRAEKNVKELSISVDLMKKESKKLLERSVLAERDMKLGHADLKLAGSQIQRLARSVYKTEAQATDLMDLLREIPGREALKLRADVASMASHLRQQRSAMDKKILKISELGVHV